MHGYMYVYYAFYMFYMFLSIYTKHSSDVCLSGMISKIQLLLLSHIITAPMLCCTCPTSILASPFALFMHSNDRDISGLTLHNFSILSYSNPFDVDLKSHFSKTLKASNFFQMLSQISYFA